MLLVIPKKYLKYSAHFIFIELFKILMFIRRLVL